MSAATSEATKVFLQTQIDRLGPFDFVLFRPGVSAPAVEVSRTDTEGLGLRAPANATTPLPITRRARLAEAGWRSADPADPTVPWEHAAADSTQALALVTAVLRMGWDADIGDQVDVIHGNRRAEHDARLLSTALRTRIEPLLADAAGYKPEQDDDEDYGFLLNGQRVTVSIRVAPGAPAVVRVFSPTNIGVTIGPELGLFLSRLNIGTTFGRFVLDTDHQAIWFEETLFGAAIDDDELRYMLDWVTRAVVEWAPRLQHMFGGVTQREFDMSRVGDIKPQPWRRGR